MTVENTDLRRTVAANRFSNLKDYYKPRDAIRNPNEKGLCLVIWNFSRHLTNYVHDVSDICNLFSVTFGFDVIAPMDGFSRPGWHLKDTNFQQFYSTVIKAKELLARRIYDRFFFFVLSHDRETTSAFHK